jgi:Helix-turn-helix domain
MEKEMLKRTIGDEQKIELEILNAQEGSKDALIKVIEYFTPEIEYLSRYIRMSKEDAVQSITLELIEYILREKKRL